jgi:hypothetical protein
MYDFELTYFPSIVSSILTAQNSIFEAILYVCITRPKDIMMYTTAFTHMVLMRRELDGAKVEILHQVLGGSESGDECLLMMNCKVLFGEIVSNTWRNRV